MIQDTLTTTPPIGNDEVDLLRLLVIAAVAVVGHLLLRALKHGGDRWLSGRQSAQRGAALAAAQRTQKLATVLSLLVSAATFVLWFVALGLFLGELGVDLTAYFATATVVGLAVGFGSQGLVQDIVIGLTLLFSDALDIGDVVEVSGQVGRVERIGLRFTTLTNFMGQTVFIPNRNIAVVGRYRRGVVRAYVDVQVPEQGSPDDVQREVLATARAFRAQHPAVVMSDPELVEHPPAEDAPWRYIRLKLRVWPGQQALVETVLKQRIVARMKAVDEKYADWMVPVTYRVS